jgi:hypothetical protein
MIASAGSKNEDKAKALVVQATISNPEFWHNVKKLVR